MREWQRDRVHSPKHPCCFVFPQHFSRGRKLLPLSVSRPHHTNKPEGNEPKDNKATKMEASSSPRRVAFTGDAFVDVNVLGLHRAPSFGSDTACSAVRLLPGGACANTARTLGALGRGQLEVSFFSAVGDDDLGRFYSKALSDEGVLQNPSSTLHVVLSSCERVPRRRSRISPHGVVFPKGAATSANTRASMRSWTAGRSLCSASRTAGGRARGRHTHTHRK